VEQNVGPGSRLKRGMVNQNDKIRRGIGYAKATNCFCAAWPKTGRNLFQRKRQIIRPFLKELQQLWVNIIMIFEYLKSLICDLKIY
jgi:hypothetical protein